MSTAFGPTKTASAAGTNFAYREEGQGEPVVFIHGAVSDLRSWDAQLPEIGRSYRAIAYSRRFHRPNEPLPASAEDPWEPHVDDLAAFLDEIGAAPAHLVGNSQGGFIGLLAALRYPDRVRSLAIEEAPALSLFVSTPPRITELLRLMATRPRLAWSLISVGAKMISPAEKAFRRGNDEAGFEIFSRGALGDRAFEAVKPERVAQARDNLAPIRAFLLGGQFPELPREALAKIRIPVLLVTGAQSPPFLVQLSACLEEFIPGAQHVEIPDASHLMHEDNPAALNQELLRFFARASTGSQDGAGRPG